MLGFIIMAGVVVNAAILLVEQALNHMHEGMHPQDAIIESARNRLRPIFMTASMLGISIHRPGGQCAQNGFGSCCPAA